MYSFTTRLFLVQTETRTVSSLAEISHDYDLVVNCTGLGSYHLEGCRDHTLVPIRGQLVMVRYSQLRHFLFDRSFGHIFPRKGALTLGGTFTEVWKLLCYGLMIGQ